MKLLLGGGVWSKSDRALSCGLKHPWEASASVEVGYKALMRGLYPIHSCTHALLSAYTNILKLCCFFLTAHINWCLTSNMTLLIDYKSRMHLTTHN